MGDGCGVWRSELKRYKIVHEMGGFGFLEQSVNALMEDGWIPVGSPVKMDVPPSLSWYQAMILPATEAAK